MVKCSGLMKHLFSLALNIAALCFVVLGWLELCVMPYPLAAVAQHPAPILLAVFIGIAAMGAAMMCNALADRL